jgi:hypothetical protein
MIVIYHEDGSNTGIPEDPANPMFRDVLVERVAEKHPEGIDGEAFFNALEAEHQAALADAEAQRQAAAAAIAAERDAQEAARKAAANALRTLGLTDAQIKAIFG